MLQRHLTKCQLLWVNLNELHGVYVTAAKGMLFFQLEKTIAFASSGGAQGPECRDTRGGECWSLERRRRPSSPSSCMTPPTDRGANSTKADEMPRSQRSLQSLSQEIGISSRFIHFDRPNSSNQLFSGIQIASQRGDLLLGPREGAWGQGSILASRNPKATYEGSEPPAQTLVGFLFDPCRNHAIWRQIYLLVSKRKT